MKAYKVSPQDGPLCTPVFVYAVQSDAIQGVSVQCVVTCDSLVGSMMLLYIASALAKKWEWNASRACESGGCKSKTV